MPKKNLNSNLHKAKSGKNDEFYTQLSDIEREIGNYKQHFKGKVVYCNCDDPYESNFFKYFASSFNFLGLKKLIATSYFPSLITGTQLSLFDIEGLKPEGKEPFKIEINEVKDLDNNGAIGLPDVELLLKQDANVVNPLKGNGDFRSEECIELLKQADIVVTNPPFSLFREYVAQLMEYDKKFIIIGSLNAITYKEIFKFIKEDRMWLGYENVKKFKIPENYEHKSVVFEDGVRYAAFGNVCWFTNLEIKKRYEDLILYKTYNSEGYPKYDNYDAINIDKVKDIPIDFKNEMGVPITFLNNYNPEQFEILGMSSGNIAGEYFYGGIHIINGKMKFARILIKNKKI